MHGTMNVKFRKSVKIYNEPMPLYRSCLSLQVKYYGPSMAFLGTLPSSQQLRWPVRTADNFVKHVCELCRNSGIQKLLGP